MSQKIVFLLIVLLAFPKSLGFSFLVDFLDSFNLFLLDILNRDLTSHNAGYLVFNPLLFILISNWSAIKGIDGDEL